MGNAAIESIKAEFQTAQRALSELDNLTRDLTDTERATSAELIARMDRAEASLNEHLTRSRRIESAAGVNATLAGFGDDSREVATATGLTSLVTRTPSTPNHIRADLGREILTRAKASLGQAGNSKYRAEAAEYEDTLKRYSLAHGVSGDAVAPITVEGDLITLVDANRYLVNASRRLPLPDNNAPTFLRPRLETATAVSEQIDQGDVLDSVRLTTEGITLTKRTFGGVLSLSEQEISWSDPAMMGLATLDLARRYAIATDTALGVALEAAITSNTTDCALDAGSADFLYAVASAAASVYSASKRLPDIFVVDPSWWQYLNSLTDGQGRPFFPTSRGSSFNSSGANEGGVSQFGGMNVAGLSVVVDPNLSDHTAIVACSDLIEFYEEERGLLEIASPSTLETIVAFRGFIATLVTAEGTNALVAT